MASHTIRLDRESNPEFYKLLEEYNSLTDRWNTCNAKTLAFKIPRIFLSNTKKHLVEIGKECQALQKDYIDWNKRASDFAMHPHYIVDSTQNGDLVYLHFTNNMRHSVNYMNALMTLLTDNYNNRYSQYEDQLNFIISITAFVIGIIGLVISLYGTFTSKDLGDELNRHRIPQQISHIELRLDSLSSRLDSMVQKDSLEKEINMVIKNQQEILSALQKQQQRQSIPKR